MNTFRKLFFMLVFLPVFLFAEDEKGSEKLVYKFNIKQEITRATWRQTQQAFEAADSLGADIFLIHMNTYGGTVLDADSIRTKILQSRIPVHVFIDNNAASAGALISIACDSIYMRPGGSIGAATVVNQTGQAMPDKYQSYMRSTMRSTAEGKGKKTVIVGNDTIQQWRRDPKIAEAMVDPSVFIEGIIDTGKVLTFTPAEAIEYGFCEGLAENVPEVLQKLGIEEYRIVEYEPSFIERIIGFLVHPGILRTFNYGHHRRNLFRNANAGYWLSAGSSHCGRCALFCPALPRGTGRKLGNFAVPCRTDFNCGGNFCVARFWNCRNFGRSAGFCGPGFKPDWKRGFRF
jgi:membrane-bound serine protease (ClpP class)